MIFDTTQAQGIVVECSCLVCQSFEFIVLVGLREAERYFLTYTYQIE